MRRRPNSLPVSPDKGEQHRRQRTALRELCWRNGWIFAGFICLLGNGYGQTFQPAAQYAAQNGPFGLASADFNSDGKLDIAIGNASSGTVSIFLGKGDGTFIAGATVTVPGSCLVTRLEAGDFTSDSKVDLLAVCGFQTTLWVLPGLGNGQFGTAISSTGPLAILDGFAEASFHGVSVADFDGDGKLDLVVLLSADDLSRTNVNVMLGSGKGTFQAPSSIYTTGLMQGVTAADMDGDGKPDIVLATSQIGGSGESSLVVLRNTGKGNFQVVNTTTVAGEALAGAFVVADVNRDGILDVVQVGVTSSDSDTGAVNAALAVFLGKGDGTLRSSVFVSNESDAVLGLLAADFRGTGNPDLIEVSSNVGAGSSTRVHMASRKGNGDGTFQSPVGITLPSGVLPYWPGMAAPDLNGDGLPDLAFPNLASLFDIGQIQVSGLAALAQAFKTTFGAGTLVVAINSATPPPLISVSVPRLQFSYSAGSSAPASQAIIISNTRSGTLNWTASSTAPWLSVGPPSGTAPSSITISVAAGLAASTYSGSVVISSAGAGNTPVTIPVTLAVSTATLGPNITAVQNGASFQAGFEAGSWVTIKGTNLSNTNPGRIWTAQEVANGLPTALDGTSVVIDGKPAYVYYISPTQINVQAPTDSALGGVNVVVTNNGNTSAPFPATIQQYSPAFFQYSPSPYAIATRYPDGALIGNPSVVPGTVEAKPGNVLIFWATGFGPTSPSIPAGVAVTGAPPVVSAPSISVGGVTATYISAVLSPGSAGLYQIAVQLPANVPAGIVPVQATVAGVQSPAGVNLFVGN